MFASVLKAALSEGQRSDSSRKAWLSRARALQHGGKGVGWQSADGKPLSKSESANLKAAKIPPAWTDVMVSSDASPSLLALGRDAKDRVQSRYSVEHSSQADKEKFARVLDLSPKVAKLLSKSKKDMLDPKQSQRTRDNAAMVYMITRTGFRPGSEKDTGGDVQAFGASTLQKQHISIKGDTATFSFTGKKGVDNNKVVKDAALAEYLSSKLQGMNPQEKVFDTSGTSAMAYMRTVTGPQYKLKDLRTWNGTAVAQALVSREPVPTTQAALKDQQRRISKAVSDHLGNTPTVALKSYINPMVWKTTEGMTSIKKD